MSGLIHVIYCPHGVDLRFAPRCYLCRPEQDTRATLLAELEAGVEGLRVARPNDNYQRGQNAAIAAVLDIIHKAGEK